MFKKSFWLFLLLSLAVIAGPIYNNVRVDNLFIDGNDISSLDTDGDITLTPNGTGDVVLKDYTGFLKLLNGVPTPQDFIVLTSDVSGILPIVKGGTGSATQNFVDLTTAQSIAGIKTFTGQFVAVSTTNGNKPCPVMTEAQRTAIASPTEGDCIVNSDTSQLNYYLSSVWGPVTGGSGGGVNKWLTATAYEIDDIVFDSIDFYKALTDHTSTVLATDVTNNDMVLMVDHTSLLDLKEDLLPTVTSQEGKVLSNDGTNKEWKDVNEGSYNYIKNGKIEHNTTGYTTYCNTVAGAEPDDFGGTPAGITITKDSSGSDAEMETSALKITKDAANRQGCGVYYDFDLFSGSHASIQRFISNVDGSHANYDDGDLRIYLMASTDNFVADFTLINASDPNLKAGVFEAYVKSFQTRALAEGSGYRLVFHFATTEATAIDLYFDEIQFRKQNVSGSILVEENEFSGRIDNDGTATIVSQGGVNSSGQNAIASVNRSASGEVEIVYTTDFFTVTPALTATVTGDENKVIAAVVGTLSTTGVTLRVRDTATALSDQDFSVKFSRQGADRKVPVEVQSSEDVSGRDIVVEASGNDAEVITANSEDIPFKVASIDSSSAWIADGTTGSGEADTFLTPETGCYDIEINYRTSANILDIVEPYIDGIGTGEDFMLDDVATSRHRHTLISYCLVKGQKLTFRTVLGFTLVNSAAYTKLRISKRSNPQQIQDTATVAARYTSNSGQSIGSTSTTLKYEDIVEDTDSAYDVGTGIYTVPVSGWYSIDADYLTGSDSWSSGDNVIIEVKVNGSVVVDNLYRVVSAVTESINTSKSCHIPLVKGDEVIISGRNSQSASMGTNSVRNSFSIVREK